MTDTLTPIEESNPWSDLRQQIEAYLKNILGELPPELRKRLDELDEQTLERGEFNLTSTPRA